MLRFFAQTHAIFGQKFECADFGTKLGIFFCEISTKSGIWTKCSHDGFFALIFARFVRFRTIFARTAFSRFFFARIFARFARFRTIFARPAFSKFFSHEFPHVSRGFARFSHDLLFQSFLFARFARVRTIFARRP